MQYLVKMYIKYQHIYIYLLLVKPDGATAKRSLLSMYVCVFVGVDVGVWLCGCGWVCVCKCVCVTLGGSGGLSGPVHFSPSAILTL